MNRYTVTVNGRAVREVNASSPNDAIEIYLASKAIKPYNVAAHITLEALAHGKDGIKPNI